MASSPGELAVVLHTHMPYVEGFGTWPFGEEWLWEATATSYLPLLDVLARAPVTLSLTPVLCDQLEAPGAIGRCVEFLREIRPASHALDLEQFAGDAALVAELRRSEAEYAAAADAIAGLGDRFLAALGEHATWTSSATHAVLPLICTDAGLALQLQTGIGAHRRRFGDWHGGFWLPECAHAPWLHEALEDAGVRATCVELTSRFGRGDPRHLHPLQTDDGPVLWPIDRELIDLVWGAAGYPSRAPYRSYDRLTERHHRIWANDGAPYDPARADEQVRADAAEWVARVRARVAGGGVCVCAFDTELFGHWWYEGVRWLHAVLDAAAEQGLALTTLDDALERHAAAPAPAGVRPSSWGEHGDLRTWSAPRVADFAWRMRTAELGLLATGARPSDRALRELLALQASDWAFIAYRDWAGEYPEQRAAGHAEALTRALRGDARLAPRVRNLAPALSGWEG
ncbi:MAG TPA: 1,4-alpha-glucan branching protein domain-containing protein [Solirubrobacteraceae bacterium]|nr:1,4-alpha-glucan branching protein domain-containing protein [Solirubrobacteraceae bacterium]